MTGLQNTYDRVKVACADGVERTFHQTAQADTFYSVPGYVHMSISIPTRVPGQSYRKKARVYGFISAVDDQAVWRFTANTDGKNADMIVAAAPVSA